MSDRFFINMPIPADKYEAVCAVLAGVVGLSVAAQARASTAAPETVGKPSPERALPDTAPSSENTDGSADENVSAGTGATATTDASPSDGEIDAHGHPWNPELHAGTKGKTQDGLWRMKVGQKRPDPLPGFPKAEASPTPDTGTSSGTSAPSATSSDATGAASAPAPTPTVDDEDEFAAFREAANKSDAVDGAAAAAATATAREFSDADLGALCNQAAVKLGDPAPIKEIIAKYVPEGQVQHSRNIPADKRDDFAKEVEAKAGIEFAA